LTSCFFLHLCLGALGKMKWNRSVVSPIQKEYQPHILMEGIEGIVHLHCRAGIE
jgi:hypothetical protein